MDARGLARADGEHYCCACIEAFDVAEVELVRARHHDVPPVSSAVERAQHGALGAAGPGDVCVDRGDPAQANVDTAVLRQYADAAAGTSDRRYTPQPQDNQAQLTGTNGNTMW